MFASMRALSSAIAAALQADAFAAIRKRPMATAGLLARLAGAAANQ